MSQEAAFPPDVWAEIDRRVALAVGQALRSGPLRNATITDGGLSIQNGTLRILYPESQGGGTAVYYGNLYSSVDGSYLGTGMLVQAPDGTDIASFSWDSTTDRQTAHLHDALNNTVVSNDVAGGEGLGRPFVGGAFCRTRFVDFGASSTSATFETLFDARMFKQHPRLDVGYRASMDTAATTGEVRVLVNGVQLGATTTEGFAVATRFIGPLAVAGAHMSSLTVEIQGRRTSGTGVLKVESLWLNGRES